MTIFILIKVLNSVLAGSLLNVLFETLWEIEKREVIKMGVTITLTKSCSDCAKHYVCKFKPDPYMGSSSGGIMFNVSYEAFRIMLLGLYGQNCKFYEEGVS